MDDDGGSGRVVFPSGDQDCMQTKLSNECGVDEEMKRSEQHKQSSSSQGRRLRRRVCRRLRRQIINEKLKALQELIPNCSKRGQASILHDAINYIQNLQFQLHLMMRMRAACCTSQPPMAMIPLPWQPGLQIPSFAPLPQTRNDEMRLLSSSRLPESSSSFLNHQLSASVIADQLKMEQSCPRGGGSTVRVLPTKIVLPHDHVDEDPSNSGSSEWFSGSDSE